MGYKLLKCFLLS